MGRTQDELVRASAREDALPGAIVLVGLRSLGIRFIIMGVVATWVTGSRSTGEVRQDGDLIPNANLVQTVRVSEWFYLVLALIALWAIATVVRRCQTEEQALRFFDRVNRWTLIGFGVYIAAFLAVFFTIIQQPIDGSTSWFFPLMQITETIQILPTSGT